jgi:hypothetical protein
MRLDYSGERSFHAARHCSRSNDSDADSRGWNEGNGETQFVVPCVQWGLKNPSFRIWKAENDVTIDLNLVGQISN